MNDGPMVDAAVPFPASAEPAPTGSRAFGRNVVKLGLANAATYFVVASLVWGVAGYDPIITAPGKLIGMTGDAILAIIITLVLWQMQNFRLGYKALVGCVLALALSPVSGVLDWA